MQISVVGCGYVGLVTGTCFADSGNDVTAIDINEERVRALTAGRCPIYEPGLEEMMAANQTAGRLTFTTDLPSAIAKSEVVFLAVGTPPREHGSADLSAVEAVAAAVGKAMTGPLIVVNKSTVPVGTAKRVSDILAQHTQHKFSVVSNPEFLKEGTALDDFLKPDRVVVGADDPEAGAIIADLYKPFVRNNRPIHMMSAQAAEMAKYAANAYLSTRISFINEVAELCEKLGVDVNEVRQGMGSDARIGFQFLYPGLGYGGSCFPKDVQALASIARQNDVDARLLESVHNRNQRQRKLMIDRITRRLGSDLTGKRIGMWGIAFKPKTDDIREAPALDIIQACLDAGADVAAYDPEALENAADHFGEQLECCHNAYEALRDADALVINTEWNEFRSPDFRRMQADMKQPLIFDGRNLYDLPTVQRYGFEYISVGRPPVTAK